MTTKPTRTPGIDVSHWQGLISWSAVVKAGIGFAFIKATDGRWQDANFHTNWYGSAGLLPRGAYHFFRPDVSAVDQLATFTSAVKMPGELPPVLDLEVGPMDAAELESALVWLAGVEKAYQRIPILYMNKSDAFRVTDDRFARYPLWLADYTSTDPVIDNSAMLAVWTFWQHTPAGQVSGIPAAVDLSWFNGTPAQLKNVGQLPDEEVTA